MINSSARAAMRIVRDFMLGLDRWHMFKGLIAVLCIVGLSWAALIYLIPAPPSKLTIATSFKGGHYVDLGHRYQEMLARSGIKLELLSTDGAVENLKLLKDPASGIQVGFLQGGVGDTKEAPELLSLGRIDYQIFWLFYRATESLDDPTQLEGKRIAVGPVGSGTQVVAEKVLRISGVTSETATLLPLAGQAAVNALKDGEVDALFIANVPDAPLLRSLLQDSRFRLMSFKRAEALTRIYPFLVRLVLPQGAIDFRQNIPAADVTLIATTNAVLVTKDLHPQLVSLLVEALLELHSEAGLFQRAGDFPTQTDPEYHFARSARDFYKNGPSILNRYLPFWLTNYAQRIIAVLAAVIAIVLPLFSYAPKLYRWLVNERLNSMYRRLRSIEASLRKDVTASDVSAIEAELESLDQAIHNLALPVRYSGMFFSARSHLDLVRVRLGSRRAELRSEETKAP